MARTFLTIAVLLVACRGGDDGGSDAEVDTELDSELDSELDTETGPDAWSMSVYVEGSPGVPAEGVRAVFHDADGAVMSSAITDASGRAGADAPGAVAVTVVKGIRLYTVMGVMPGEEVRLDTRFGAFAPADPPLHVNVGAYPTGDQYRVSAGCASRSDIDVLGGFDVPTGDACRFDGDRVDLLAVAYGGGVPVAFTSALDVPAGVDFTLSTPWRTDWRTPSMTLVGAPVGETWILGEVAFRRRGVSYFVSGGWADVDEAGTAWVPVMAPGRFAEDTVVSMQVAYDVAVSRLDEVVPGPVPPSRVFTLADLPTPPATVTVDATDVERPSFAWPGASVEDVVMVQVRTEGTDGTFEWSVLVPGDATRVTLPALPEELAKLRPLKSPVSYAFTSMTVGGIDAHDLLVERNVIVRNATVEPSGEDHHGRRFARWGVWR